MTACVPMLLWINTIVELQKRRAADGCEAAGKELKARAGGGGQREMAKRQNPREAAGGFLASLGCEKPKVAANLPGQPVDWPAWILNL